jgi:hypothetical protein
MSRQRRSHYYWRNDGALVVAETKEGVTMELFTGIEVHTEAMYRLDLPWKCLAAAAGSALCHIARMGFHQNPISDRLLIIIA